MYLCIFFLFSASILRHVYLRNGLGVGHLTRVYGGTKYNTDANVCTVLKIKKYSTVVVFFSNTGQPNSSLWLP